MDEKTTGELTFRSRNPDNLEGPQEVFDAAVTPTESFFVRSHFDVPAVDRRSWELGLEGAVERPCRLSYQDLLNHDHHQVRATMECAGNGRARLGERAQGVPWRGNAIGTADWGGVSLRSILEEAGLRNDVVEVIFVGADKGEVDTCDGGKITMPFARSIPREKALSDEVLIATHMNGEPLTPEHGFPARLVVPGWYGMASVKWLTRIVASTRRFDGYFQTEDYAVWQEEQNLVVRRPLTKMAVKSHVGYPIDGQMVHAGSEVVIRGFAWGGESEVVSVEVSFDGCESFEEATLLKSEHRYAWRAWEYVWKVPETKGEQTIYSRARTRDGEVQPPRHDWLRGGYAVNAIRPVTVFVNGEESKER